MIANSWYILEYLLIDNYTFIKLVTVCNIISIEHVKFNNIRKC